jgi:FkbM family methyltransferase
VMKMFTINCEIDNKKLEVSYRLDPNGPIGAVIQSQGSYEPEVSLFLMRVLRDGDLFVDIGAHVGYFSILAAKLVGEKGQVLSFEPEDINFVHLQSNVALNDLYNITLFKRPVAEKIEMRSFYINSDGDGGHALWDPGLFPGNERSKAKSQPRNVETITLDAVLSDKVAKKLPKIIKIDTEGAEKTVLEGGRDMLEKGRIPFVICELHEFGLREMGASQDELRSFMRNYGYETYLLPPTGGFPKLIPHGVQIQSKVFLNILFSQTEWLSPYWPVEFVDPNKFG